VGKKDNMAQFLKQFEVLKAGINSLFAGKIARPGTLDQPPALLTIYAGLTGCWVVQSGKKDENRDNKLEDALVKQFVGAKGSAKRSVALSFDNRPTVSTKHDLTAMPTSELIKRLTPSNEPVRVRLIVQDPMIFHKVMKFSEPPTGRDALKGFFTFLPPPLSVYFRPLEQSESADGYYNVVAMTTNLLRTLVEAAGEKALALESIVPLSSAGIIAMRDAMVKDDEALLFPGPRCNTLVMGGVGGPYIVRTFTPGWKQVADAMQLAGIPAEEAVAALLTRAELGGRSVHRKEVDAFKLRLKEVIDETVGYYVNQFGKTPPRRVLVCGQEIPPGLFDFEKLTKDPVALIAGRRLDDHPNLLEGTDEPLFKKGRITFRFEPEARQFVEVSDAPTRTRKASNKTDGANLSGAARRKRDRLNNKQEADRADVSVAGIKLEDLAKRRETLAVAFLALLVLGFSLNEYLDKRRAYKTSWDILVGLEKTAGSQAGDLAKLRAIKKPLWTQKMLAITEELKLSPSLWITDVYVEDAKGKLAGKDVSGRELTIEGAALPDKAGHVKEIANYMERLKNNKPFMEGVSKLYFGNVALDEREEDVVRFKLKALYDNNVVVTLKTDTRTDGKSTINDVTGRMQQHNEKTDEISKIAR
jgi:hypothetical protein